MKEVVTGDSSSYSIHSNSRRPNHYTNANDVIQGYNYNQIVKKQPVQMETTAPAIDFKLNVKIDINSGKCVLHANKNG